MTDKCSRLNKAVKYGRLTVKVFFPVLYGFAPHCCNLVVADAVKQHIDDIFHIAYNRNFCFNILTDFSRVNVNVNYLCVFTHLVGSRNSSVTESCTAYDYKVGFVKSTVGNSLAVSAEHSEIKLMLAGHNTDAHHS